MSILRKDFPETEYRAHPAIANSDLSLLKQDSLLYKRVKVDREMDNPTTSSGFSTGNLLDCKLLTPRLFDQQFYLQPEDIHTPNSTNQKAFLADLEKWTQEELFAPTESGILKIADVYAESYVVTNLKMETVQKRAIEMHNQLKPYMAWIKDCNGRTVYSQADAEKIAKCEMALLANPKARNLMRFLLPTQQAISQPCLFWNDKTHAFDFKAMLDRIVVDVKEKIIYLIDLKTTAMPLSRYAWTFENYDYDRQLAHYYDGVWFWREQTPRIKDFKIQLLHVVVSTVGDPSCRVFSIPTSLVLRGQAKRKRLLQKLQFHTEADSWALSEDAQVHGFDYFPQDVVDHICKLPL